MASILRITCLYIIIFVIHQINSQSVECSGSCICSSSITGVTCILNCDGKDKCKDGTLKCRAADACIVNCNGDNSCSGNSFIDASGSTDVNINCVGANACSGNTVINCGTASCDILCDTSTSCEYTSVNAPDATSLSCTGDCGYIPPPFAIATSVPTVSPKSPTNTPTKVPSLFPTLVPSKNPTIPPTHNPSNNPTLVPSLFPTVSPTRNPISFTSNNPTFVPSNNPTFVPSNNPTFAPSNNPTSSPIKTVTIAPSKSPTKYPTNLPTIMTTDEQSVSQTNTNTENAPTHSAQKQKQMIGVFNGAVNPIYYIFIVCCLIIMMSGCVCCGMLYFYFALKRNQIAEDISITDDKIPKQMNSNNTNKEGINSNDTLTIPQNTNTTTSIFAETPAKEIEMVQNPNDNVIDGIVNDINTTNDQIMEKGLAEKEPSQSNSSSSSSSSVYETDKSESNTEDSSDSSSDLTDCSLSTNNNQNRNDKLEKDTEILTINPCYAYTQSIAVAHSLQPGIHASIPNSLPAIPTSLSQAYQQQQMYPYPNMM